MPYRFLEHTADVKFLAEGKTIEEAFLSAFSALNETIKGKIKVKNRIKKKISVSGTDLENLLYKFLEEFLFLLDSQGFLAGKIEKIKINEKSEKNFELKAEISGDKSDNYKFTNNVKAITYNEMFVKKESKKITCQVVIDV